MTHDFPLGLLMTSRHCSSDIGLVPSANTPPPGARLTKAYEHLFMTSQLKDIVNHTHK